MDISYGHLDAIENLQKCMNINMECSCYRGKDQLPSETLPKFKASPAPTQKNKNKKAHSKNNMSSTWYWK